MRDVDYVWPPRVENHVEHGSTVASTGSPTGSSAPAESRKTGTLGSERAGRATDRGAGDGSHVVTIATSSRPRMSSTESLATTRSRP